MCQCFKFENDVEWHPSDTNKWFHYSGLVFGKCELLMC